MKIIRTICSFKGEPSDKDIEKLGEISQLLIEKNFSI